MTSSSTVKTITAIKICVHISIISKDILKVVS